MIFNLGIFSKYRTELMGVATGLIILCHMPAHGVAMPGPLTMLLSHGGAGCDMFLFLSGLGMYCSLTSRRQVGGHFIMVQEAVCKIADTLSFYMHPSVCHICLSESLDHRTVSLETEHSVLLVRRLGSLVCCTHHGAISGYASFGQIVKRKQEMDMDVFTRLLYMGFWIIDRARRGCGAHTVWLVSRTLLSFRI